MKIGCKFFVILLVLVALTAATVAYSSTAPEGESVLTLPEAIDKALRRDVLVRDARQSLEDARAALIQASARTPSVTVSSNASASESSGLDPESDISGTEFSSRSYHSNVNLPLMDGASFGINSSAYSSTSNSSLRAGGGMSYTYAGASVGADLSYPLPIFRDERVLTEGGRWSADIGVRSAEMALEEAQRRVVADALDLFFSALRSQRQADIAEASRQEAEELLRITQEKLRLGKIAEIEVMEALVSADSARTSARTARSAAARASDTLKDFLGMPLETPLTLSHDDTLEPPPEPLDETLLFQHALTHRVDLQQMALNIQSAELSLRRKEADSKPGVFLSGSYARSGEGETVGESYKRLTNPSWYIGITTTLSLTGKEDRAAIEKARGTLELTRTDERLHRDAIRLEIRRLVREVEDAAANAALLAQTVKQAEENLNIRQLQYERGLIRPIDVVQTESQLNQTRLDYSSALIDYQLAGANLNLAIGESPFPITADFTEKIEMEGIEN